MPYFITNPKLGYLTTQGNWTTEKTGWHISMLKSPVVLHLAKNIGKSILSSMDFFESKIGLYNINGTETLLDHGFTYDMVVSHWLRCHLKIGIPNLDFNPKYFIDFSGDKILAVVSRYYYIKQFHDAMNLMHMTDFFIDYNPTYATSCFQKHLKTFNIPIINVTENLLTFNSVDDALKLKLQGIDLRLIDINVAKEKVLASLGNR